MKRPNRKHNNSELVTQAMAQWHYEDRVAHRRKYICTLKGREKRKDILGNRIIRVPW